MSETKTVYHRSFAGLWLVSFLVMKLGGTLLAAWSWWWILFPIVPVLAAILGVLGLLG